VFPGTFTRSQPLRTADGEVSRLTWVDYARGIGILLVVFGHVWRGLKRAGMAVPCYGFVDSFVYSFHMPLFFVLSGMFAEPWAQKPARAALVGRARTILYPYVVWSLLDAAVATIAGSYTNRDVSVFRVALTLAYEPYAHFWFLYVLAMCLIAFLVLYKIGLNTRAIALVALLFWATAGFVPLGPWGMAHVFRGHFIHFAAGALLSGTLRNAIPKTPLSSLAALCGAQFALLAILTGADGLPGRVGSLLSAGLGTGGVLCAAGILDRLGAGGFVRFLGMMSLQIYVAHVIAASGTRILLRSALHVESVLVHVIAGTVAGAVFPLALDYVARKAGFTCLFTLGTSRKTA